MYSIFPERSVTLPAVYYRYLLYISILCNILVNRCLAIFMKGTRSLNITQNIFTTSVWKIQTLTSTEGKSLLAMKD